MLCMLTALQVHTDPRQTAAVFPNRTLLPPSFAADPKNDDACNSWQWRPKNTDEAQWRYVTTWDWVNAYHTLRLPDEDSRRISAQFGDLRLLARPAAGRYQQWGQLSGVSKACSTSRRLASISRNR